MKKIIAMLILSLALTGCYTTSKGGRTGIITKFSNKGFFVKTWEGEMILGGIGASGNMENTWKFSVEDEKMVEKAKEAQKAVKTVSVAYHQEWIVAPWRAETTYFIDDVK